MVQLVLLLYVYHAHLHLSMRLCSSHLGTHTYGPEPLSVRSCNGTWYVNANRHQTEITLDAHLHCTFSKRFFRAKCIQYNYLNLLHNISPLISGDMTVSWFEDEQDITCLLMGEMLDLCN